MKSFDPWPRPVEWGGRWGYINEDFSVAIPAQFENASYFVNGRARIELNLKYGYIDGTGTIRVPTKYDAGTDFSEDGLTRVEIFGNVGKTGSLVVDRDGAERFSAGDSVAMPVDGYNNGRLRVEVDQDHFGFVDTSGKFVIPPDLEDADPFSEGLAAVRRRGEKKWRYIDVDGHAVFGKKTFDETGPFSEGLAFVRDGSDEKAIDLKGKRQFSIRRGNKRDTVFVDGCAVTERGYVTSTGHEIRPPRRFERWFPFSEGLAAVAYDVAEVGSFFSYIDKTGQVPPIPERHCQHAGPFVAGLAEIQVGGSILIDKTGQRVWPRITARPDASIFDHLPNPGEEIAIKRSGQISKWMVRTVNHHTLQLASGDRRLVVPVHAARGLCFNESTNKRSDFLLTFDEESE